jgi:hypothetical protein
MFMIPIPPNEQRDRSHGREQQRQHAAAALGRAHDLTQVADIEVGRVGRADSVPRAERLRDLPDRLIDRGRVHGLGIDHVHVAGEPRLQAEHRRREGEIRLVLRELCARRRERGVVLLDNHLVRPRIDLCAELILVDERC